MNRDKILIKIHTVVDRKRENSNLNLLRTKVPKILPENFYREHPLATQAQTRGVSEKVDVRNTDPLELLKRVPVPLTQKQGLKKGPFQSSREKNPDVNR